MSDHKPHFEVQHVLVCDDVRRENTGKLILIGVYGRSIVFNDLPAQIELTFWLEVDQPETGTIPFQFQGILAPKEKQLFYVSGTVTVNVPVVSTHLVLGQVPLHIEEEGELSLQLKQYDDDWVEIKTIAVEQVSDALVAAGQKNS